MRMDHEEMVAREILKLARKVTRRRNHHLRAVDLTTEQADALIFFSDQPHSSVTTFKRAQGITHQTARLIVQRLAKRGLVMFTPDPGDGRSKLVSVTAAGTAKRQQLLVHGWQTSATLFTHFSPDQQQTFLTLLKLANENLESSEEL